MTAAYTFSIAVCAHFFAGSAFIWHSVAAAAADDGDVDAAASASTDEIFVLEELCVNICLDWEV